MRYLEIPGLKSEGDLPPEERDLKDDIPLKKSEAIGINTDDADDYGDTAFLLTNSKPFEVEHSTEPGQELFKRTGNTA